MADNAPKDYSASNISLSAEVLLQKLEGEAVLLSLSNEHYYGLNELGLRFWELCEQNSSVSTAIDTLLEEYEVERQQLVEDVNALISDLIAQDLVSVAG